MNSSSSIAAYPTSEQSFVINTSAVPKRFNDEEDSQWNLVAAYYGFFGDAIIRGVFNITPASLKIFTGGGGSRDSLTFSSIVKDLLMCDFESVVTCSRHNRNLVVSLLMSYIIYWIAITLLSSAGLRGMSTPLFLLVPVLTLWLAYGMAPTCLPMVPTCILQDIVTTVQILVPARVTWPTALQAYPRCLGDTWMDDEKAKLQGLSKLPPPVVPQAMKALRPGMYVCICMYVLIVLGDLNIRDNKQCMQVRQTACSRAGGLPSTSLRGNQQLPGFCAAWTAGPVPA